MCNVAKCKVYVYELQSNSGSQIHIQIASLELFKTYGEYVINRGQPSSSPVFFVCRNQKIKQLEIFSIDPKSSSFSEIKPLIEK